MSDLNDASLIRRVLDGEATPEEHAALREAAVTDEVLRHRIEAEGRLRDRLQVILQVGAAPSTLAGAIRQQWKDSSPPAQVEEPLQFEAAAFSPQPRLNFFALAASITIIASAVLIGIFGTPLFTRSSEVATQIADIKAYIANEHVRCASDSSILAAKVKYRDPRDVERELTALLSTPIQVIDLSSIGFGFVGGGPCHVPPAVAPSGHLVYQAPSGRLASIFIEPYQKGVALEPGLIVTDPKVGLSGASNIWTDGTLIYMVVVCNSTDLDAITRLTRRLPTTP